MTMDETFAFMYYLIDRTHYNNKNFFSPKSDFGSYRLRVITEFYYDKNRPEIEVTVRMRRHGHRPISFQNQYGALRTYKPLINIMKLLLVHLHT
jgi:hypothetical protein